MATMEMNIAHVVCYKCGTGYSRRKGFFPISYAPLYKGVGYIHICRECIEKIYSQYLFQCKDEKMALRQLCRKLDLYWNENVFNMVNVKSTSKTIVTKYLEKLNTSAYVGKCYDDTLEEEGILWNFGNEDDVDVAVESAKRVVDNSNKTRSNADEAPIFIDISDDFEVTDDIIKFWGSGLTRTMYGELEQRRHYWMSNLPEGAEADVGTEALIKQICSLEIDINRDRRAGRSVEKSLNVLNTLLGSANLKPNQNRDNSDSSIENTPMGVWIWRFENERPIPEPDPELKDVDGIIKYILTWFYGHLAKMLNIRNAHSKLYEEEMARLRVERPEYEDEDDDSLLYDVFGDEPMEPVNEGTIDEFLKDGQDEVEQPEE